MTCIVWYAPRINQKGPALALLLLLVLGAGAGVAALGAELAAFLEDMSWR